MSILIDDLVRYGSSTHTEIGDRWYMAKCIDYHLTIFNIFTPFGFNVLSNKVKDAYKVLTGKARAYHFKEDEK